MAKEEIINGKRCRRYNAAKLWVSEYGDYVAVESFQKIAFSKVPIKRATKIHIDSNGERYVKVKIRGKSYTVFLKDAVYACFCPPKPNDGKTYEVYYKDGNPANLYYKNLGLREVKQVTPHTTAASVKFTNGLTITSGGEVLKNGVKVPICDCIGDADTDLMRCIRPHVSDPNKMSGRLFIDDLMAAAGYVACEKYDLKDPVILHKDNDPMNFSSDNLEWVECNGPRYIEYQKRFEEWKHKRNVELNPGKPLPPGW